MVLPLDSLWLAVPIMTLVIICTARYMSAPVFWALLKLIIVVGLTLAIISTMNRGNKRKRTQATRVCCLNTCILTDSGETCLNYV
jgi:hypothetical protein